MAKSFFIKDKIKNHFSEHISYYYFSVISIVLGLFIGVILSFTDYIHTSLLSNSDNNLFDYITGDASYKLIFYSRLKDVILCVAIIFVLNLTIYSSFLSYFYIGYQLCLIVLSSSAIIEIYGFSGVINVLLFLLPLNLINFFIINVLNALCVGRASRQKKYSLKFFESFKDNGFFIDFLICLILILTLCVFNSFVVPLFVKSFVIMTY